MSGDEAWEDEPASTGARPAGAHVDSPEVFISYASVDVDRAHQVRIALESNGHSCWMAPDDVLGTTGWPQQIADAIAGCRAMLVLVSEAVLGSRHVPKEADLAFSKGKPLIPVRLEPVTLSGSLEYLLSLSQWVELHPGPVDAHVEDLLSRVSTAVAEAAPPPAAVSPPPGPMPRTTAPPLVRPRSGARRLIRVLLAIAAIAVLAISLYSFLATDPAGGWQAQELRLDPASARTGASVTVHGRNWAVATPVEIQWDRQYGTVIATGVSDGNGSFSIPFTVPGSASIGNHPVWACQYAAGTACSPGNEFKVMLSATLTVVADSPPVARPDRVTTSIGRPVVILDRTLIDNDADPDGDPLCSTVRFADPPSQGTLTRSSDAAFTYVPDPSAFGDDGFTYQVCETAGGVWSNPALVTVEIVFDGGVSIDPTSGRPGTRTSVTGHGFPAGRDVVIEWEGVAVIAAAADGGGGFTASVIVPEVSSGTSLVTACASDSTICAGAWFEVLPRAAPAPPPEPEPPTTTPTTAATTTTTFVDEPTENQPPTAGEDAATVDPGTAVVIDVLGNDVDPEGNLVPASLRIVTAPRRGRASVTGPGRITYTPPPDEAGFEDRLRYEVCDGAALCAQAWVTIVVPAADACALDSGDVRSFSVDPRGGSVGSAVTLTLELEPERLEGCTPPWIGFLWAGGVWGSPTEIRDGVATSELEIPSGATPGGHTVSAVIHPEMAPVLASTEFTIAAPAVVPAAEPDPPGETWPWWILPLAGIALLGAGATAWLRSPTRRLARLRATAARADERAGQLLARAHELDADLEACESGGRTGIVLLPGDAPAGESAGGTAPYLLGFDNPYAPPQIDDDHRGWYHPRRKEPIRGVVIHTPEGLGLAGLTADRVARFFATSPRPLSAHAVVDARGAITLLPDDYTALHVARANSASLGLVVCLSSDPSSRDQAVAHAARWCRVKATEYGFPMEQIGGGDWEVGGGGVIGHSDLDPGAIDPVSPTGEAFPLPALIATGAGLSHVPGIAPVRRGAESDPCARIRADAERAHEEATGAAREAARALTEVIEAEGAAAGA